PARTGYAVRTRAESMRAGTKAASPAKRTAAQVAAAFCLDPRPRPAGGAPPRAAGTTGCAGGAYRPGPEPHACGHRARAGPDRTGIRAAGAGVAHPGAESLSAIGWCRICGTTQRAEQGAGQAGTDPGQRGFPP